MTKERVMILRFSLIGDFGSMKLWLNLIGKCWSWCYLNLVARHISQFLPIQPHMVCKQTKKDMPSCGKAHNFIDVSSLVISYLFSFGKNWTFYDPPLTKRIFFRVCARGAKSFINQPEGDMLTYCTHIPSIGTPLQRG